MKVLKCAAAFVALSGLVTVAVPAEDPVNGRWAADPSFCAGAGDTRAQSPLVVTNYAVRWFGDSCRIGRTYRTGDTVHIEAFCWGEAGERTIPVSLRSHGDRLQVTWDRGVRGALADMRRCP
jgi:hypothetical protein